MTTKEAIAAYLTVLRTVADAIREAGSIPSGHLYAAMMPAGITLAQYERIIDILTADTDGASPIVRKSGDMLHWNG